MTVHSLSCTLTKPPNLQTSKPPNQDKPFDSEGTSPDLHLEDTSHIDLTLTVLGLICDGQYSVMQNYLRCQSTNIKSINIVREVAIFLQTLLQSDQVTYS